MDRITTGGVLMGARIFSGLMVVAIVGVFMFAPASTFAGNAADAMSKLKEQSAIKAKSAEGPSKADGASAEAKEKAKKAVKGMVEKGKKLKN